MAANGDNKIPRLIEIIIDKLGLVVRNVHTCFGHDFNGHRIEAMSLDACRLAVDDVTFQVVRPPFGHLAAARVAGA